MSLIRYEVREAVAEIMMDRPPVNVIDHALMDELLAAFARARDDEGVRAVILGSAVPGRFSAGLDLPGFLSLSAVEKHALIDKLYARLNDAQVELGKPSIAAIGGTTRGGGMTMAISCDMIVAAQSASLAYPEIDVGLIPGIHFAHLHRIVGRYRAFELLFTGLEIDATEALRLGLVNRVAPGDGVMEEARRLAQVLCSKSPSLVRMARAAFQRGIDIGYREGVVQAVEDVRAATATPDSAELLAAFAARPRRPKA